MRKSIQAPLAEGHAERDYFVVHRQYPHAGLYLSMPWRAVDGHYIAISRALTDANGDFAGAVVGTMRLTYFETMLNAFNLGAHDTIDHSQSSRSSKVRSDREA